MATYRINRIPFLPKVWSPDTTKAKVRGGALATTGSRNGALQSQAIVARSGRRYLASTGLQGSVAWQVVDGVNPEGSVGQKYPLQTGSRVLLRGYTHLTPGYRIGAKVLVAKSGPTQFNVEGGGTYYKNSSFAKLQLDVSYNKNGGVVTITREILPPFADNAFQQLNTSIGGAWKDVHEYLLKFDIPPGMASIDFFTENVQAFWTITGYGGLRPIDISLYEEMDDATYSEDYREGTLPSFLGNAEIQEYAISGLSFPDQAYWGSIQSNKSARDQQRVWGPRLADWGCWVEGGASVNATEGTATTLTSTSFRDLWESTVTTFNANAPGWTVASGGYGRTIGTSGKLELRDKVAVIPVKIRVYARMTTVGPTGTLRFMTAPHSLRDVTITGTTFQWYTAYAVLQCPVHASVPGTLLVHGKVSSGTMELRYFSVEHWSNSSVDE